MIFRCLALTAGVALRYGVSTTARSPASATVTAGSPKLIFRFFMDARTDANTLPTAEARLSVRVLNAAALVCAIPACRRPRRPVVQPLCCYPEHAKSAQAVEHVGELNLERLGSPGRMPDERVM